MIRPALTFSMRRRISVAAALLLAGAAFSAQARQADDDEPPTVSRPMVEPTAPSAGKALNTALERLARDPRNVDALLGAGNAALALGDNDAALGFFGRADQVAGANPTVKAAIAGARLHLDDPVEALRWYADAERYGGDPTSFALDRGLAYDLVGDNLAAIAQYRTVIARSIDPAARDEATRREAISLAIGGDRRSADLALLPLLQRQDRAAWRAHIFVLAIAGRAEEADKVAHATMPADLAQAITPYLNFMVRLTPAQQAAVASQGRFPRAAEIGRDDPRVAAYAAAHPRVPLVPAAKPAAPQPVAVAAEDKRHRRHVTTTPSMTMLAGTSMPAPTAPAAAEPDLVLPAPPPPATGGTAQVAMAAPPAFVPGVSRTTIPAPELAQNQAPNQAPNQAGNPASGASDNPVVPRPTVLSRLDMPPPGHRTLPPRAALVAQPPAASPPATSVAPVYDQPYPTPVGAGPAIAALAPPSSGIATVPVPASTAIYAARTPVVEPTPRPVHLAEAHPDKAHAAAKARLSDGDEPDKTRSAAERKAALDKTDKSARGKDEAKAAKGKTAKSAKDDDDDTRAAKDKSGRKKTADDDDATLGPCKPAPKKAHGKAAQRAEARHAKTKRGAKGRKQAAEDDSETCIKAHGDRPDGPGGVSRDSDDAPVAKGKKGKGKGGDRDADRESEKPAKGKARYASRIWVQVLTGGDRDKMAGEWRAMVHKARVLKGHKPWLTPWHSNFRLLTGPFDSDADAQDFIADLRRDGVSGFEWTSPAGQAVDSLPLP